MDHMFDRRGHRPFPSDPACRRCGDRGIGSSAFYGCTSLEEIVIPANAQISAGAFEGCTALTRVTLPYSSNLAECFSGCDNIREVCYLGNEKSWEKAGGVEWLASLGEDVQLTLKPRTANGTCSIALDSDLKWTLDESGDLRIYGNGPVGRRWTGRYIPYGWEDYATEIHNVIVEPGVTSIGDFRGMGSIENIYIPAFVTKITAGGFPFARNNTTVHYAGTEEQWNKIDIERDIVPGNKLDLGSNDGLDTCTFVYNYPVPVTVRFSDVPDSAYCARSVRWAVEQSITMGTGGDTFSPDKVCTRSEILTFLWRASGSPEPTIGSPFSEIHGGYGYKAYYYKAALWAYEKGIFTGETWKDLSGTAHLSFGASTPCTRRDTVVYLWKAAGSPKGYSSNFPDVSKTDTEAVQAVGWAAAQGITNGVAGGGFVPDKVCSRGEIVTFLYRALA